MEFLEDRVVPAGWTALANAPASGNVGNMTLLTDGRVLVHSNLGAASAADECYILTPDATGSYVNGTWSQAASMGLQRLYFGSNVLPDGRVFTVGGEYSGSSLNQNITKTGEIYDPVLNTWTPIANFPHTEFGDDPTMLLPNGQILAGYIFTGATYLYDPATDTWTATGSKLRGDRSDEETWTLLPDGSVLSYDLFNLGHAQRYVPATGTWVDAGTPPNNLSSVALGDEFGGAMLLPDGRVFEIGASGKTAYYTPSTNSWVQGPDIPGGQGADDSPCAILPNGNLLLSVDTPLFNGPTTVYEFNPITNVYTDVTPAIAGLDVTGAAYTDNFLMLPTGQALFSTGGGQLAVYDGVGGPNAAWRPTVTGVAPLSGSTYTLTGTQLTGISAGASYGDDSEMDENYPIVQLSAGGNVYYARTHDWTPSVATGAASTTTQFDLPAGLPAGSYSLTVVAAGISSVAVPFDTNAAVTNVTSSNANGTYATGASISIQVTFSGPVVVTGTPTLALNSGGSAIASYTFGSGTNTLTFTYTVAAGDATPDLDYTSTTALALSGGTITDMSSAAAAGLTLPAPAAPGSLGANKDIVIDTSAGILSVTSTTANGTYSVGAQINVTVNFTQAVTLAGGTLTVNLDTGGSVTFGAFTNQTSISGIYTVGAGQNTLDLNSISPLVLSSGATLKDSANVNAKLTIPTGSSLADLKDIVIDTPGIITSVTSTTADGVYGVGASIDVTVNFSEAVTLAGGTLSVTLDTGATVTFAAFAGQTSVSGKYTVAAGQNSADLNSLSPLTLSGGATLKDGSGNNVILTIPTGESLADLDNIVIDTTAPTVTISAPSAPVTAGGPITYTITYTDPNFATSSLHASDITLISTGTATGNVSVSEANGSSRIVIISNITGDGTLSISLAAGTAVDAAGNEAPGAGPSAPFDVDNTGPSISISAPSRTTTTIGPITYTITYADPHFNVSTLTEADITLNKTGTANGTVSVSTGNGSVRTVTISNITGDGRLSITIAANTANDTVGNEAGPAGPSRSVTVSNTPFMAIGSSVGNVRLINGRTGQVFASFRPLDIVGGSKYTGVVEVALGDLSGDGLPDVFVSAADPVGVNGLTGTKASKVFVYDGATLAQGKIPSAFRQFTPFTDHNGPGENGSMISKNGTYVNGVNIAVGDVNGDGVNDLIAGSRGGSEAGGSDEYGRLVVIDGASAPGSDTIIGSILTPFGETYQKGVVVAAGDMDGDGAAEIAVTRGGPVAESNTNKTVKLKALKLTDGVLTELPLSGNSFPLAPFAGITGANGEVLARDARVTFVDQNGDGKEELVISILDGISDPTNTQVRIATFSINSVTGVAAPVSAGTGPSQSYLVGDHVLNQGITRTNVSGDGSTDLALIVEEANSGIHYLNPRTGGTLAPSLVLPVSTGGVAIDGI